MRKALTEKIEKQEPVSSDDCMEALLELINSTISVRLLDIHTGCRQRMLNRNLCMVQNH